MESILETVKKLLGVDMLCDHFNADIIVHINSALMTLTQLGIGPAEGFIVTSDAETWADFLGDSVNMEAVKTYVYQRVRLYFDPPQSQFLASAMENQMRELEWRLNVEAENAKE